MYRRLGHRIEKEVIADDSKVGGPGEVYRALMTYAIAHERARHSVFTFSVLRVASLELSSVLYIVNLLYVWVSGYSNKIVLDFLEIIGSIRSLLL